MDYKYTKSIATDFGGQFNIEQFHNIVKDTITLMPVFKGVNMIGDSIELVFSSELSESQLTTLNSLVSSYTYTEPMPELVHNINKSPQINDINTPVYKRIGALIFPGGTHCHFKVYSYMDSGVTSYSIKITDITNKTTILEKTMTNTEEAIVDLGKGNNIPVATALFEISAKRAASAATKYAHIDSITIFYQ